MSREDILTLAERLERSNPQDTRTQRELFEQVRALRATFQPAEEVECSRRLEAAGMLIGYLSQMGSLGGEDVQRVAVRLLRSVVEQQTAEDLRRAAQAKVAVEPGQAAAPAAQQPLAALPSSPQDRSATDVLRDALIGQILLKRGHVLEEHIQAAMRIQRSSGMRIGDVLVKIGACSRQQLAEAIQFQASMRRARGSLAGSTASHLIKLKSREPHGLGLKMVGEALLGELLVERNAITRSQLERALGVQRVTGKRIGEVLVEMGATTPETIDQALRSQGARRSFTRGAE